MHAWRAGNAVEGVNGDIHVLLRMPVALYGGGISLNHACLLTWNAHAAHAGSEPGGALIAAGSSSSSSSGGSGRGSSGGGFGFRWSQRVQDLATVVLPSLGAKHASRKPPTSLPLPPLSLSADITQTAVPNRAALTGRMRGALQLSAIIEMPGALFMIRTHNIRHLRSSTES